MIFVGKKAGMLGLGLGAIKKGVLGTCVIGDWSVLVRLVVVVVVELPQLVTQDGASHSATRSEVLKTTLILT